MRWMRRLVSYLTLESPASARDTVDFETDAAAATSLIVGRNGLPPYMNRQRCCTTLPFCGVPPFGVKLSHWPALTLGRTPLFRRAPALCATVPMRPAGSVRPSPLVCPASSRSVRRTLLQPPRTASSHPHYSRRSGPPRETGP